jgi:hypothetical protein
MKRPLGFLPLVFLFVFFVFPISSLSSTRGIKVTSKHGESLYLYKDYYALVVGVGNYERWPRLPHAVDDAREVASKLKKLGFEVKLVLDPSAREMRTELSEMVYKMGREENRALLFYYAGHGETEKLADKTKMGYIVPKDCPLLERDPMGFATHAISMRDIESASLRIRAKHVIMLFDSCFSGSLFALVRAVPADITEKSALPVRQYITAGREEEQVPDKSMFKRCLLIGLEGDADLTGDGYITGSELGMYLSDKVVNYTHRRQHPQYGKINNPDLDRGDFIFVPVRERQRGIAEGEGLQEDRSAIAEELRRLREERRKSEELVEQMKQLLDAKGRSEEKAKDSLAEKKDLEEELKRLEAERAASSRTIKELETEQAVQKRFTYIPKEVKEPKIRRVRLRSTPATVWEDDIEKMIMKYNFFIRGKNEGGDFVNDFVDNGDGTVTDLATGLMWEKQGTSSIMYWHQAQRYVSKLNKRRFVGHSDWRIPTTEELVSLLECNRNNKGLHIDSLFEGGQKECWSSDQAVRDHIDTYSNRVVDFSDGSTRNRWAKHIMRFDRASVRAVRTVN